MLHLNFIVIVVWKISFHFIYVWVPIGYVVISLSVHGSEVVTSLGHSWFTNIYREQYKHTLKGNIIEGDVHNCQHFLNSTESTIS